MGAGLCVDQLPGDAQAVAGAAHRAFEHVAHPKLAPDPAHIDREPLVGEGGVARDHEDPWHMRQAGYDVLGDAIGEIVLFGVRRQVVEGQHRVGGFIGQGGSRRCRCLFRDADREGGNGPVDVLEFLRPETFEDQIELAGDFLVDAAGDNEAAGRRDAFETGCDIDAVTENVPVIGKDIAHMHAHAELHQGPLSARGVALGHPPLHRFGAGHGIDDGGKFGEEPVAHGLEQAAVVEADMRFERAQVPLEGAQRALFIGAYQRAVSFNIGRQYGRKTPFHPFFLP